jgi:thiol-disulfide isomerase/thioredoxin
MKIIKIGAVWCPGCIIMHKKWNKIAEIHPEIDFEEFDFDMDEDEIAKYNVGDTLPVAILIKDDKEVSRLIGEKNEKDIIAFLGETND